MSRVSETSSAAMPRHKRPYDPLRDLALAARAAARFIGDETCRRLAARDAQTIPKSPCERHRESRRGKFASHARAVLASLPDAPPEQWPELQKTLRGCAEMMLDAPGAHWEIEEIGAKKRA